MSVYFGSSTPSNCRAELVPSESTSPKASTNKASQRLRSLAMHLRFRWVRLASTSATRLRTNKFCALLRM